MNNEEEEKTVFVKGGDIARPGRTWIKMEVGKGPKNIDRLCWKT